MEAFCAIALAVAAVAALTNFLPLLFVGWAVGGFGIFVGIFGLMGWNLPF